MILTLDKDNGVKLQNKDIIDSRSRNPESFDYRIENISKSQNNNNSFRNKFQWLIIDTFVFGLSGLVLGFLLDELIPEADKEESAYITMIYIILQIFLCITIIYIMDLLYENAFERSSDETFGMTMFSIIFFTPQSQLYMRSEYLYSTFTGKMSR